MMNHPLDNDACEMTRANEARFIDDFGLRPLDRIEDATLPGLTTPLTSSNFPIHSRSHNSYFVVEREHARFTAQDMESYFSSSGHTLTLDLQFTYVRFFSLDIDCICKRNPQCRNEGHLNEARIVPVMAFVHELLQRSLKLPGTYHIGLWKRSCGFHIYSNVPVSMPTHLALARHAQAHFHHADTFRIEVPRMMPLPWSAKKANCPYEPVSDDIRASLECPIFPNYHDANFFFFELFDYVRATKSEQPRSSIAEISCRINSQTVSYYITRDRPDTQQPARVRTLPVFDEIQRVVASSEDTSLDIDQLRQFFMAQSALRQTQITNDAANEVTNEALDYSQLAECFLHNIARVFAFAGVSASIIEKRAKFVEISLNEHGALYLQHYAVMIHKWIDEKFIKDRKSYATIDEVKAVLRELYRDELTAGDPCLLRFFELYDSRTYECYGMNSYKSMMHHLRYLYANQVDPYAPIEDTINQLLMRNYSNQTPPDAYRQSLPSNRFAYEMETHCLAKAYVEILIELGMIRYESSSTLYYILKQNAYYVASLKLDQIPSILTNWVGNANDKIIGQVEREIRSAQSDMLITQNDVTRRCDFQFATKVGVFNSITSLYSASSPFLFFVCFRDFGPGPLIKRPSQPYDLQNYECLDTLARLQPYVRAMTDGTIGRLFVHFQLAPAIIQLAYSQNHVEEHRIGQLMQQLNHYEDLSEAAFLVNTLRIDPRFIYILAYVYDTHDGFLTLDAFDKFAAQVFAERSSDWEYWQKHFTEILGRITYDDDPDCPHVEKLQSIRDGGLIVKTRLSVNCHVRFSIIALCYLHCEQFKPLIRVMRKICGESCPLLRFNREAYIAAGYTDFSQQTTLAASRQNLERAIRLVFGQNEYVDENDRILTRAFLTILLSGFFVPDTCIELLSSISIIYVPTNVKKKMILYYGHSGVGKSYICNVIKTLLSPQVIPLVDFETAMKRATVASRFNAVILTELQTVTANHVKTATGNDSTSGPIFFSQVYELRSHQAHFFGATNSVIKTRKNVNIDRVTINRFHVIQPTGEHIEECNVRENFFDLMTSHKVMQNVLVIPDANGRDNVPISSENEAYGIGWLAYAFYVANRKADMYPVLNDEHYATKRYREDMYRQNNRLYKALSRAGLACEPYFVISAADIRRAFRICIREKKTMLTEQEFLSRFEEQFCKIDNDVPGDKKINDMQSINLINHILVYMKTRPAADSHITPEMIRQRAKKIYGRPLERTNAIKYVERTLKFDTERGFYPNVEFEQPMVSYDDYDSLFHDDSD